MADRITIGSVAVTIVPTAERFADQARASLISQAETLGDEVGDVLAARINSKLKDIRVGVKADTAVADAELNKTKAKADELNNKKVDVNVDVKNQAGIRSWITSLIAGAVAIAPAFGVAGVGVAAFGAVAYPTLKGVTTYLSEVASGSSKAKAQFDSLSAGQRQMAGEILQLKENWSDLSNEVQPEVANVLNAAIGEIDQILPEIMPVVRAAGPAIAGFIHQIGSAFTDPQAQNFFHFVAQNLGPDVHEIGVTVVALLHTVFALIEGMQPVSLALLHIIAGLANGLSFLTQHAPVITDIVVLAIGLYKPIAAIAAIDFVKTFSWIPSTIGYMKTFMEVTEGATLAQKALFAEELLADAVNPAYALAVAAGVVTAALVYFIATSHDAESATTELIGGLGEQDKATGYNIAGFQKLNVQLDEYAKKAGIAASGGGPQGVLDPKALGAALAQQQQYSQAAQQSASTVQHLVFNLDELQQKYGLTRIQAEQLASTQKGAAKAFQEGGTAAHGMQEQIAAYVLEQQQAHQSQDKFIQDLDAIANSALGATNQIKALTDAYNNMIAPNLNAEGAVVTMKDDLVLLNKALKDSHDKIGDNTAAQRNAFQAYQTYIGQINQTEQATLNATGAQRKHDDEILLRAIPYLQNLASHNSSLRGGIEALIKTIQAIPPEETAHILVTGLGKFQVTQTGAVITPSGQVRGFGGHTGAHGLYLDKPDTGRDEHLVMVRGGELMVPPEIVKSGAVDHLRGWIPGFASGGVAGQEAVGSFGGFGPWVAGAYNQVGSDLRSATVSAIESALTSMSSAGLGSIPGAGIGAAGGSAGANQAIARRLLPLFGWGPDQFPYLVALWNRESGWNQFARNPSSGAYGIPQSLPADKMAAAGPDWLTNPVTQERWGLGYIRAEYGSPAGAWGHELAAGWYDNGGWAMPGWNLVLNGTGAPEPVLNPSQWDAIQSMMSGASGGSTYVANFMMDSAMFESRVQNAFRAMDMGNASKLRVGRPN